MEIVLGVSMESTAIRMVLVEGDGADGVTVDHDTIEIPEGAGTAAARAVDQVVAAILGTRESAVEGGHRLVSTGVAWTDHTAAAQLRDALHAHGVEDVVLVSELHAASALAQAIGQAVDCERTALVFLEGDTATLAVVQTADGAVVKVQSRAADPIEAVPEMIAGLESLDVPPQAVFVMGPGLGAAGTEAIRSRLAGRTALPVHAPQDADLALARGAALASAHTPRFEAETVGLSPMAADETAAGPTQMAPAGYMAPLGYSAVPDEDDDPAAFDGDPDAEPADSDRKHFILVGSALSAVFVVGVAALVISLAVSVRPAVDERPDPGQTAGQTTVTPANAVPGAIANPAPAPAPAPQTIQAPIPVVQEAPRTVYVAPPPKAPVVEPAAPAPVDPAPAAPAPQPAPAAVPTQAPVAPPVVAPIIPPWLRGPQLPSIFLPPGANVLPAQSYPSQQIMPQQTYPQQSYPQQSYPSSPVYPSAPPASASSPSAQSGGQSESGSDSGGSQSRGDRRSPLWPIWPQFG